MPKLYSAPFFFAVIITVFVVKFVSSTNIDNVLSKLLNESLLIPLNFISGFVLSIINLTISWEILLLALSLYDSSNS